MKWCRYMHKGNFTIEASVYVSLTMFIMVAALSMGIDFYQESRKREESVSLMELDIVQEFYTYRVLGEIGEEVLGD